MSTTIYAVIQSALSRLTVVPSRNIPTGKEVERLLNKIFRSSNSVITEQGNTIAEKVKYISKSYRGSRPKL